MRLAEGERLAGEGTATGALMARRARGLRLRSTQATLISLLYLLPSLSVAFLLARLLPGGWAPTPGGPPGPVGLLFFILAGVVSLATWELGQRTAALEGLSARLVDLLAESRRQQRQLARHRAELHKRRPKADAAGGDTDDLEALHRQYARRHDPALQARLVDAHIRLATHLARRFANRGEPIEDLEQVALLALVKALNGFLPDLQVRFSTYATPTILGELKRHLRDRGWSVRPPRRMHDLYLRTQGAMDELTNE